MNDALAKTLAEVRVEVSERLARELGQALEAENDLMLGREAYARREKVVSWIAPASLSSSVDQRQLGPQAFISVAQTSDDL